jgi:RHS repeat-associated protein
VDYDDQGRVYRQHNYSVDQSSGSVSSNSLTTNVWYGHRGLVSKVSQPGGLVSKALYDGASRATKQFATDGGGDSAWSDAGNVTADVVLTQTETQYDADSNPIFVIRKERFHDETATGELGNATTAPKARVSYAAAYYDAASRLTASVNVGTNGGSAYTRPSSVPSRSDTVLVMDVAYNAAAWAETQTDPRGIAGKTYYDNLGRIIKTIEAYTDGTPSNSDDKTTEYTYDGSSHILTLKADMPSGAYQTTQYVYGVTTSAGSDLNCNDCLATIRHPDPNSGDPSSTLKETVPVNALNESKTFTDRNGSVHTYSYDVVGRLTADAVTTLATGVDGAVRRLTTAYDTGSRPSLYTSYDAASGGSIVNQVQQVYNGLGQLITEYQAVSGVVNTSTTPKVHYSYSEMSGGANHSRLVSMTYPNGRVLTYNYASGLDSNISRLSSISDGSTTLESYAYLGLNTVVRRAHPEPGVDLTYIKLSGESNGDAGDQYTGLDRFGRVVDQRWIVSSSGTATDRFLSGYDRNGNPQYRDNPVNRAFGELYHANGSSNGYDQLNQLTDFARGTLNTAKDSVSGTASRTQSWTFDALGNWTSVTTDSTTESRSHDKQNEITSITGLTTPGYDANGNMTGDQTGKLFVFDAWNRLVQAKNSGGATLVTYQYDAIGRRIIENPGTSRALYYSSGWQVLEERVAGAAQIQYVRSPVYLDAIIERDRDTDNNGTLEERLYLQQDANWDVTALVTASGTVVERFLYDPYGQVTFLTAARSTLSGSAYGWTVLHQGRRLDPTSGTYDSRFRALSPTLGRWMQTDPLGLAANDANPFWYVGNRPIGTVDPVGLAGIQLPGGFVPVETGPIDLGGGVKTTKRLFHKGVFP